MILDQIDNAGLYHGLHPGIKLGLDYLSSVHPDPFTSGRENLDGDNVFALRQEYDSKPYEKGLWESHRRYADIQFVCAGSEQIGYAPLSSLETTRPYDEEEDYSIHHGTGQFLKLSPGWFAIFFPTDGHMPCIALTAPAPVRKIVVKVRLA